MPKPLTELTNKDVTWRWGARKQKAFEELKSGLGKKLILVIYCPKPAYSYEIEPLAVVKSMKRFSV